MKRARFGLRRGAASLLSGRAGFTFLELMIGVTLVAIVGAIGIPLVYPALTEFRLSAAAEEIMGAVEYARSRAVVSGAETRVTFDVVAETVLIEERRTAGDFVKAAGTDLSSILVESATYQPMPHPLDAGRDYLLDLSYGDWSGGVEINAAAFGGSPSVVFSARGVPSAGGTVRLMSSGQGISLDLDAYSGGMTR